MKDEEDDKGTFEELFSPEDDFEQIKKNDREFLKVVSCFVLFCIAVWLAVGVYYG